MLKFRFCLKGYDFYAGMVNGEKLYNILPEQAGGRVALAGGYVSFGYIASKKKLDRATYEFASDWINHELNGGKNND